MCLLTATHLINIMPLSSINFEIPYERLNKTPVGLGHLRVYGCLDYVSTIKSNISKFDPRFVPCVLVGYPPDQKEKGYRMLNLETKQIIVFWKLLNKKIGLQP